MASGALSIKLRCASWQQLATIYQRDLSRGTMFLKATNLPPLGTQVRIDLTLPSSSVIVLNGTVTHHVNDPARGQGVELKLAPLPTGSVWMIESALASEQQRLRPQPQPGAAPAAAPKGVATSPIAALDNQDQSAAESELVRALAAEAESLKRLNPFLVLGVAYDVNDAGVRSAFGELTKKYHPDRFARYESQQLRAVAAEIFILIRDAYRRLGDANSRAQVIAQIRNQRPATPVPMRTLTPPGGVPRIVSDVKSGPVRTVGQVHNVETARKPPAPELLERAVKPGQMSPHEVGTVRKPELAVPLAGTERLPSTPSMDAEAIDDMIEAAQRFEAALEIDPSNERAARELAEMRRQATNERKGLLSRLMGKKE